VFGLYPTVEPEGGVLLSVHCDTSADEEAVGTTSGARHPVIEEDAL
jgi:hypothetical protein